MTILNGYATLTECKNDNRITSTDTTDDTILEALIENASRFIDLTTGRRFYPLIQTRHFDVPLTLELRIDDDLLSITSVTNGDDAAIAAADYYTRPYDDAPYWAICLKAGSGEAWESDGDGNTAGVIDVAGVWGYHTRYSDAWLLATTLAAAITTTSATSITVTAAAMAVGHVLKIDSEYLLVTAVSGTTITVQRGFNGSTAATHLILASIYMFRWQGEINQACRMIVNNVYHNRFGENPTGTVRVTGAGVVISPEDVPALAYKIMDGLMRLGY